MRWTEDPPRKAPRKPEVADELIAWLEAQPPEPVQFMAAPDDPRVVTFNVCLDVYHSENRRSR